MPRFPTRPVLALPVAPLWLCACQPTTVATHALPPTATAWLVPDAWKAQDNHPAYA